MDRDLKAVHADFDATSDLNAEKIASLVKKLNTQTAEFWENWNDLKTNETRTKISFTKRILCSLKIS